MLTNKIISVLIILISFSLTSCGTTDVIKNEDNKQIEKKVIEIKNSINGKKGKSVGGEIGNKKSTTESISDSDLKFNK